MPNKFKVSVKARADIKDIFRYSYGQFGEAQALKYRNELEACFQLLADTPDIGRKCEEIRAGYQRHGHAQHVVFYRKHKNDIFIIRVLHGSADAKRHL